MPMNYPRSSLTTAVSGNKAYAIGGIDIGTSTVGGYNEEYGIKDIPSSFEMTVDLQDGLDLELKQMQALQITFILIGEMVQKSI